MFISKSKHLHEIERLQGKLAALHEENQLLKSENERLVSESKQCHAAVGREDELNSLMTYENENIKAGLLIFKGILSTR